MCVSQDGEVDKVNESELLEIFKIMKRDISKAHKRQTQQRRRVRAREEGPVNRRVRARQDAPAPAAAPAPAHAPTPVVGGGWYWYVCESIAM